MYPQLSVIAVAIYWVEEIAELNAREKETQFAAPLSTNVARESG